MEVLGFKIQQYLTMYEELDIFLMGGGGVREPYF